CRWRFARSCGIVILLLGHIVHTRGEASHADTTQLDQHAERQARNRNHLRVRSLGTCHPDRHRQRPAVGAPYDIIGLVIKLVEPDHRQAMGTQGMEAIVDRDISNALLMGSMSFSCSNGSSSICESRPSTEPARTP